MTPTLSDFQTRGRDFQDDRKTQYGFRVPNFADPVTAFGTIATAGMGNSVVIVTYVVKANWYALIEGIVFGYSAGALNVGDVTFTVDVDRPLGSTSGFSEKDYGAVPFALGAFVNGPVWPCCFRRRNRETLRVKALDNIGVGAGKFQAALIGWTWPEQHQKT